MDPVTALAVLRRLPWRVIAAGVVVGAVVIGLRQWRDAGIAAAEARWASAAATAIIQWRAEEEATRRAFETALAERDSRLADARAEIDALKNLPPIEVIHETAPLCPVPRVALDGLLDGTARANRAIAGALRGAERGPYEAAAAGAEAENGTFGSYADLLNWGQLMTVHLAEATVQAHACSDYVAALQRAGVVDATR